MREVLDIATSLQLQHLSFTLQLLAKRESTKALNSLQKSTIINVLRVMR